LLTDCIILSILDSGVKSDFSAGDGTAPPLILLLLAFSPALREDSPVIRPAASDARCLRRVPIEWGCCPKLKSGDGFAKWSSWQSPATDVVSTPESSFN